MFDRSVAMVEAGQPSLERGDDVPPIHTSVAVFLDRLEANEEQKAAGAERLKRKAAAL